MVASVPHPQGIQFGLHEIGGKDHLSDAAARTAALDFVRLRAMTPQATHVLAVGGFDKDPRELWDIPEAKHYVALFAYYVSRLDPRPINDWGLTDLSMALIAMCCGIGRITATDPVTGVNTIEFGNKQ